MAIQASSFVQCKFSCWLDSRLLVLVQALAPGTVQNIGDIWGLGFRVFPKVRGTFLGVPQQVL